MENNTRSSPDANVVELGQALDTGRKMRRAPREVEPVPSLLQSATSKVGIPAAVVMGVLCIGVIGLGVGVLVRSVVAR